MPMYQVTLKASYFGRPVFNEFTFIGGSVPEGTLGSLAVLAGMGLAPLGDIEPFEEDTFASDLALAQVANMVYVEAVCKNLYSVTDFYTFAFAANTHGQRAGEGLSPTQAAGFNTDRTVANIRRGQKRFAGVSETDTDAGGFLNSGGRAVWEAVGNRMDNVTVVPVGGSTFTYTPYVFSKERVVDPDTGEVTYEAWPDEATALMHIARINQWTLKAATRTQTSRQYA